MMDGVDKVGDRPYYVWVSGWCASPMKVPDSAAIRWSRTGTPILQAE